MSKPLTGKTIVVTRAADQAKELIATLGNSGAEVIHIPTIEITEPDSWQFCDDAMDKLHDYDWIIFTSANGVRFFTYRLSEKNGSVADLNLKHVAAVGNRTAGELRRLGVEVDLVPRDFKAEGLVESFQRENLSGKNILIAKVQKGRDVLEMGLRAKGAKVDAVAVYKTQRPRIHNLIEHLNGHRIDLLTFTSPSTFRNFLHLFGKDKISAWKRNGCAIAAIGNVTATAIAKYEFKVDICPKKSTIPDLVSAILEYYN